MSEKIVSIGTYALVWFALMSLLAATIGFDFLNLSWGNAVVAIGIAVIKALIVAIFFMHLGYGPRLNWVFAVTGIFFLLILASLSMTDYVTRVAEPVPGASTPTSPPSAESK